MYLFFFFLSPSTLGLKALNQSSLDLLHHENI